MFRQKTAILRVFFDPEGWLQSRTPFCPSSTGSIFCVTQHIFRLSELLLSLPLANCAFLVFQRPIIFYVNCCENLLGSAQRQHNHLYSALHTAQCIKALLQTIGHCPVSRTTIVVGKSRSVTGKRQLTARPQGGERENGTKKPEFASFTFKGLLVGLFCQTLPRLGLKKSEFFSTVCLGSTNIFVSYFYFLCLIWHVIERYG